MAAPGIGAWIATGVALRATLIRIGETGLVQKRRKLADKGLVDDRLLVGHPGRFFHKG
jgi:hypothetical protein